MTEKEHIKFMLDIVDQSYSQESLNILDYCDKAMLLMAVQLKGVDTTERLEKHMRETRIEIMPNEDGTRGDKKTEQAVLDECRISIAMFALLNAADESIDCIVRALFDQRGASGASDLVAREISETDEAIEDNAMMLKRFKRMCTRSMNRPVAERWKNVFRELKTQNACRDNFIRSLRHNAKETEIALFMAHLVAATAGERINACL